MSDHPVRTMVTLAGEDEPEVGFQHYFVRLRHSVPVRAVRFDGAAVATPAPGVLDAIARAERIVVCPSNPLVSIGPILAVPGVRDALVARRDDVVGVCPIIAGRALKGPADRLLVELGHQSSVVGVARLYADWVGTLVIDHADADLADAVRAEGLRCVTASTVMSDPGRSADLARTVLDARG
jgi:LPPG:FO 2-phospho-L-lactate transferase